jgi:hypothetical protein
MRRQSVPTWGSRVVAIAPGCKPGPSRFGGSSPPCPTKFYTEVAQWLQHLPHKEADGGSIPPLGISPGRLVARTPCFQLGEEGSKPFRGTSMKISEEAVCGNCSNLLVVEYAEPHADGTGMIKLTYFCAYCIQKARRFAEAIGMAPVLGLTHCTVRVSAAHPDYQVWALTRRQ